MSTDPKKVVKTILFADFMACMFMIAAMQMTFSWIPVAIFTAFALLLFLSGCFSLRVQYKKYKISIYLYLLFINLGLSIFSLVIAIASQI